MVINVTDQNFKEKVIEKSKEIPVIVDFWAEWCQPCLMLSPTLEKLAEEYDGKLILVKVNLDKARTISMQYKVMSIPSVKMFKDGKIVDEFVGAIPEPNVKEWIDKNLN